MPIGGRGPRCASPQLLMPRRHPLGGGYERGSEVRRRLLQAAIELFGREGRNASTRAITARAGANVPAISYYFGGKDQLYRACLQHISDVIDQRLEALLASSREQLQAGNASQASAALTALLDGVVDLLFAPDAERWAMLLIREQIEPGEGFEIIVQSMTSVMQTIADLVARLSMGSLPQIEPAIVAAALYGQLVSFRINRVAVARMLNPSRDEESLVTEIKMFIKRQVEALLLTR